MHVASSARIFFTYNGQQDFVFLDKFPLQEFSFFLGIVTPPPVISNGPSLNKPLFNTCHTVSVFLPFVVQRSTRSHVLKCDACVPRSLVSLVIRWCQKTECLSRVCTAFLALFAKFKMGKHKKKKKKIAQHSRLANICILAKKPQRQLYCTKKTTATFASSQIGDRWIGK